MTLTLDEAANLEPDQQKQHRGKKKFFLLLKVINLLDFKKLGRFQQLDASYSFIC